MLNKHFEMPGVTMHEQQLTPQKRALSGIGSMVGLRPDTVGEVCPSARA